MLIGLSGVFTFLGTILDLKNNYGYQQTYTRMLFAYIVYSLFMIGCPLTLCKSESGSFMNSDLNSRVWLNLTLPVHIYLMIQTICVGLLLDGSIGWYVTILPSLVAVAAMLVNLYINDGMNERIRDPLLSVSAGFVLWLVVIATRNHFQKQWSFTICFLPLTTGLALCLGLVCHELGIIL